MSIGRLEQKCFQLATKGSGQPLQFQLCPVSSLFHARGAATEKALSPIRRRVRGKMTSPDDEARSVDRAAIMLLCYSSRYKLRVFRYNTA